MVAHTVAAMVVGRCLGELRSPFDGQSGFFLFILFLPCPYFLALQGAPGSLGNKKLLVSIFLRVGLCSLSLCLSLCVSLSLLCRSLAAVPDPGLLNPL